MQGRYSLEEGGVIVRAARHAVELYLRSARFNRGVIDRMVSRFTEHDGISVSIKHYPLGEPRGSAGFVKGPKGVNMALVDAAIAASTEDQRFVPVSHHELGHIAIEVSLFSGLKKFRRGTKLGKAGILVKYGYKSGFLLPGEMKKGAKAESVLGEVCRRAGLHPHDHNRADITFYTFTTQTFREIEPNGEVEEVS
ncbi:MAG: TIGR00296 family protein [Candidatus Micrarchaeales archaeon]